MKIQHHKEIFRAAEAVGKKLLSVTKILRIIVIILSDLEPVKGSSERINFRLKRKFS